MKHHAIKPKIYIFCNGEVAEPQYFQEYKNFLGEHNILVRHKQYKRCSPWELIEKVSTEKQRLLKRKELDIEVGDQCWCVFDVDEYWGQNPDKFKAAIKLARENNILLAWSNECFELWYLLHFQVLSTGVPRNDYHTKLERHFRKLSLQPYTKNCSVFSQIFEKQSEAIKNAKRIYKASKVERNPSTAIFKLAEEINKHFG